MRKKREREKETSRLFMMIRNFFLAQYKIDCHLNFGIADLSGTIFSDFFLLFI